MNNVTSNKMGVVKKCPNCGATVEMSMVRCPECGYHFGGVEANSSARKLAAMLNASKDQDEDKRSNIVVNFPVPTTKADLLEFMADLLYRAKHYEESGEYKMASAFKAKFKECATKARIYFRSDPDFQHLFEIEADSKKIRWRNFSDSTKWIIVYLSLLAVLLAICAIGANWKDIKNYFRENKAKTEITQFTKDYKELPAQVESLVRDSRIKEAESVLRQVVVPDDIAAFYNIQQGTKLLDNAFMPLVQYYIDKNDIDAANRIGDMFKGKLGSSYQYEETMVYNSLMRIYFKKNSEEVAEENREHERLQEEREKRQHEENMLHIRTGR